MFGWFRCGQHIFRMTAAVTVIAAFTRRHWKIVLDDCCQDFFPIDIQVMLFGIFLRVHDLQKFVFPLFRTTHSPCQKVNVLSAFDFSLGKIPIKRTTVIEVFPIEIAIYCSSLLVTNILFRLSFAIEFPFCHNHSCFISIATGFQRCNRVGAIFQQIDNWKRIRHFCLFFCKLFSQLFLVVFGVG